jgi:hypothetical protein
MLPFVGTYVPINYHIEFISFDHIKVDNPPDIVGIRTRLSPMYTTAKQIPSFSK